MTNYQFLAELTNQVNYIKFLCEDPKAREAITDVIMNIEYDQEVVIHHHELIKQMATTIYKINNIVSKNPELYDAFITLNSDLPCQKSE